MAKIKQGILGGFSGKVAGVVGTSWKGRAVMKSQPLSVANPRTEAQQEQRGKFSKIAELASAVLTTFVQPVENPISGNISGYNLFVKDNKAAFNSEGVIQPASFMCGGGKIINLEGDKSLVDGGGESLLLAWENSAGLSAIRKTDKVYAVAVGIDNDCIFVGSGTHTRNSQSLTLEYLSGEDDPEVNDKYAVIYACVSADGREVSVRTTSLELTASSI